MYKNFRILCIIPARKGSRRLKNKNILKINRQSLVERSIVSAKKSQYIDKIIVSTDDENVIAICKKKDIDFFIREKKLSKDNSKIYDVIKNIIFKTYKKKYYKDFDFDLIVLLQPTTPYRAKETIDIAIKKLYEKNSS